MRYLLIFLFLLTFQNIACKKNENSCNVVTITSSAPGCGGWGIVVNGVKYPSSNIPAAYQQPGIFVCVEYELYQDMRMCACCGGTWANIKSMTYYAD
jgi:hypothetical protein